eukprot:2358738-Alexandrium_andersonii.AAC.1
MCSALKRPQLPPVAGRNASDTANTPSRHCATLPNTAPFCFGESRSAYNCCVHWTTCIGRWSTPSATNHKSTARSYYV